MDSDLLKSLRVRATLASQRQAGGRTRRPETGDPGEPGLIFAPEGYLPAPPQAGGYTLKLHARPGIPARTARWSSRSGR